MRRLLFILVLSLPCYGQILAPILNSSTAAAPASPTIVQSVYCTQAVYTIGSPCVMTITATQANDILIVGGITSSGTFTVSASGASFALGTNCSITPTLGGQFVLYKAYGVSAGITSVSAYSGNTAEISVTVVRGFPVSPDPLDKCNITENPTGHANPQSCGTNVVTGTNDVYVAFAGEWFGGSTATYTWSGFTVSGSPVAGTPTMSTKISTGNQSPTLNSSNTSGITDCGIISLKY